MSASPTLAVRNYLTSLGVTAARMQTISYGKERPAVNGSAKVRHGAARSDLKVVTGGRALLGRAAQLARRPDSRLYGSAKTPVSFIALRGS